MASLVNDLILAVPTHTVNVAYNVIIAYTVEIAYNVNTMMRAFCEPRLDILSGDLVYCKTMNIKAREMP